MKDELAVYYNYMHLEDQVCSLELSKELKELGVKQESLFWWCRYSNENSYYLAYGKRTDQISAFTSSELGDMLPDKLKEEAIATDYKCHYWLSVSKDDKTWEVSYCGTSDAGCKQVILSNNEVDARAKMLIYLLKNNLL